jgi:hypothetical protein
VTETITLKFDGEKVRLGGREYVLPSLSVKQTRQLWEKIRGLNKGITEDSLPDKQHDAVEVIHAALSRNYPSMTFEEAEDLVDMNNMRRLLLVVSGLSGLTVPGSGPVGETAQPSSTGPISTEPSSPAPAGATNTLTT